MPVNELYGVEWLTEAVARAGVSPDNVEEVFMGHVLNAGVGQAPAKQAAIKAGLSPTAPCTAVNKVCASGMKGMKLRVCGCVCSHGRILCCYVVPALMFGAQSIMLGLRDVVVVGGMESMSQAPHLSKKARSGARFGDLIFTDAIQTVRLAL